MLYFKIKIHKNHELSASRCENHELSTSIYKISYPTIQKFFKAFLKQIILAISYNYSIVLNKRFTRMCVFMCKIIFQTPAMSEINPLHCIPILKH